MVSLMCSVGVVSVKAGLIVRYLLSDDAFCITVALVRRIAKIIQNPEERIREKGINYGKVSFPFRYGTHHKVPYVILRHGKLWLFCRDAVLSGNM